MTLVRIEAPHFVAGIVFDGQVCVEEASILRWCVGRRALVEAAIRADGWRIGFVNKAPA